MVVASVFYIIIYVYQYVHVRKSVWNSQALEALILKWYACVLYICMSICACVQDCFITCAQLNHLIKYACAHFVGFVVVHTCTRYEC